jgi:hypothetical protein
MFVCNRLQIVGAIKLGTLVLSGDGGGGLRAGAVDLHELGDVELGSLEGLDLADEDVLGMNFFTRSLRSQLEASFVMICVLRARIALICADWA